jgi:hypothetical protein
MDDVFIIVEMGHEATTWKVLARVAVDLNTSQVVASLAVGSIITVWRSYLRNHERITDDSYIARSRCGAGIALPIAHSVLNIKSFIQLSQRRQT